jgi:hypothetical protein
MSRFKAAGIHLFISAIVVLLTLVLMLFLWYPKGFFKLLGGSDLVYIIAGVDLTLGPLLTFAVFKSGKKGLKLDLIIIGAMQLVALIYGASVMFNSRPVFIVLEESVFKVTLASELDNKKLAAAINPKWRKLSLTGPVLVAAVMPRNEKEKQELVSVALSGLDLNVFPKYFVAYDSQRQVALNNAKPLAKLRQASAESNLIVGAFLSRQKQAEENFVFLPVVKDFTAMSAVLDAKNANLIEIIEVDTD